MERRYQVAQLLRASAPDTERWPQRLHHPEPVRRGHGALIQVQGRGHPDVCLFVIPVNFRCNPGYLGSIGAGAGGFSHSKCLYHNNTAIW